MIVGYIKGDLLESHIDYIAHGCNTKGLMGAGVALAIKDKYPKAYEDYFNIYKTEGLTLGDIHVSFIDNGRTIINAITQAHLYGRSGRRSVSYDAIKSAFRSINLLDTPCVAIPKIGCSLGGGSWDIVSKIIDDDTPDTEIVVYEM